MESTLRNYLYINLLNNHRGSSLRNTPQKRGVKNKMKVYKINTNKMKIEELDAPYDEESNCIDCDWVTEQLGCDFFDVVRIGNGDCVFVDDAGLHRKGIQPAFELDTYHQPLIGNGIVMGADSEGRSTEPNIKKRDLTKRVTYCALKMSFDFGAVKNRNN
jgi:hypothetical protein